VCCSLRLAQLRHTSWECSESTSPQDSSVEQEMMVTLALRAAAAPAFRWSSRQRGTCSASQGPTKGMRRMSLPLR
jgi:hypothetical protein